MTQEEKLEEAKRLYETANADQRYVLESLFPELKESEEEKIRKWLIAQLQIKIGDNATLDNMIYKAIAWLEKQGEDDETKAKIFLINKGYPIDTNGIFPTYEEMYNIIREGFENQGEKEQDARWESLEKLLEADTIYQMAMNEAMVDEAKSKAISAISELAIFDLLKPIDTVDANEENVDTTNKVEPKFKVGDWCIDNEDGTIFQIVKVLDNTYTYKTNEGKEYSCTHYSLENDARLWTIQDAKDGDVICYEDEMFILKNYVLFHKIVYHCCYDGKNFIPHSIYSLTKDDFNDVHPATKEQRELLFAKIKEAGHEWDAEKKELKKIEPKPQRMVSAEAKEVLLNVPAIEDTDKVSMTQEQRQRQANAYNALQRLVHRHFSKANLTKKINEIFGTKGIDIDWHCYEDGELSDHNAMFSFTNDQTHDDELCGDFDIYYLECKTPNQWGDEVYVTEVGTDFFNH